MDQIRQNYQITNINTEDKDKDKGQSQINEKPEPKKILEQKVENEKEFSRKTFYNKTKIIEKNDLDNNKDNNKKNKKKRKKRKKK